jgi:hypothetical protein
MGCGPHLWEPGRGTLVDGGGGMTLLPKAKYPRERVEELHDEAVRTGALVAPFL